MISLAIPGMGEYRWSHLVLDVNGTLITDGVLEPGVAECLGQLSAELDVHLLTSDTRGTAARLAEELGVGWARVERGREAEQKRSYVRSLGADRVIAIGNGNNDALMLEAASLGIAVLGVEGCAVRALTSADLLARNITDALALLLHPIRLLSSLRC